MTNKELVKRAITEAFVNMDATAIEKYWSDRYIQHNPNFGNGREALKQLFGLVGSNFKCEIGLIVADGDFVMAHSRYTGLGPKPLIAVDIFRVKDGKIAEHWDVLQEEIPAENTVSKNPMFTTNP